MASSQGIYREYWNLPYGKSNNQRLYTRSKDCLDFVKRLNLEAKLEVHNGCVNSICWNDVGTRILSGSDDQHLCITDPFTRKLEVSIQSGHLANIFSAKFLPNTQDNQVVSCSGDGMIYYTYVDRPDQYGQHPFDCHFGTTYEIVTVPQDSNTFLSCGEDGSVRWFDLRIKDKCNKEDCKDDILINCRRAVTSLAINPCKPYQLSVGCSDSSVRIFDRRMLGTRATGNYTGRSTLTGMVCRFTPPLLEQRSHRITSLSYSSDGTEVLASYSSEKIYLFNICDEGSKVLSKDTTPANVQDSSSAQESSPRHPPIKRLRLRGDWSDTGPNARPERERSQPAEAGPEPEVENNPPEAAAPADPAADRERRSMTIMQRMSDMLTRWLEGASRTAEQRSQEGEGQATEEGAQGQSQSETPDNQGQTENQGQGQVTNENEGHGDSQGQGQAEVQAPSESGNQGQNVAPSEGQVEVKNQGQNQSQDEVDVQGHVESVSSTAKCEDEKEQGVKSSPRHGDNLEEVKLTQSQPSGSKEASQDEDKINSCEEQSDEGEKKDKSEKLGVVETDVVEALKKDNESDQPSAFEEVSVIVKDSSDSKVKQSGKAEVDVKDVNKPSSSSEVSDSDNERLSAVSIDRRSGAVITQSVEPLVSLHYKSEGTTSGMIKLDYPASGTEQGPNLPPSISDYTSQAGPSLAPSGSDFSERTGQEGHRSTDSQPLQDKEEPKVETSDVKDSSCETKDTERGSEEKPTSVQQGKRESKNTKTDTLESDDSQTVLEAPESEGAVGGIEEKVDSNKSEGDSKKSKCHTKKLTRSLSDSEKDISPSSPSEDFEMKSANERFNATTVKTLRYDPDDDPTNSHSSGDEMPRRLSADNVPGPSGVARPAVGRCRRMGHSGPPTGDFQLFSGSEDSDDDNDDDVRTERAAQKDRDEVERNLAALRLQELYRKRQAEREKEDQLLMNIHRPTPKYVYSGHRNARTMIKEATFWGERYVMSGSDCGHIFVWDRFTSELVMFKEADKHVVNCLQPHPTDPVLASSGIDYDIKLWMPTAEIASFDSEKAEEVVRRNQLMLEETRDTITVPASFMLRMLASLNHIRSGRRQGNDGSSSSSSEEEE